jgi:hypothetical protein
MQDWPYLLVRLPTGFNSRTLERNLMKSDMEFMPPENTSNSCFLISYNAVKTVPLHAMEAQGGEEV